MAAAFTIQLPIVNHHAQQIVKINQKSLNQVYLHAEVTEVKIRKSLKAQKP